MDTIRYIFRNITVLNVVLLAAIMFMAFYTLLPQFHMGYRYNLPSEKKTADVDVKDTVAADTVYSLSEYVVIAEGNPFHPDRKMPPEKKAEEKPLSKPDFVLYGTVMAEDVRIAYLEDLKALRNTTGRGRRQTSVREGDVFSGFTLKEVGNDRAVMVRGEERLTVKVHRAGPGKESAAADPEAARRAATSIPQKPSFPSEKARMTMTDEKVRAFFKK